MANRLINRARRALRNPRTRGRVERAARRVFRRFKTRRP